MRGASRVEAGAYVHEGPALTTGWHSHDLHQLEYAVHGLVEVETAAGHYLLPPHQAAWIPAGLAHQSIIHTSVKTVSVFLEPAIVPEPGDRVRVIAVTALLREMILHALRWPVTRLEGDPRGDRFFRAMADTLVDGLEQERPLALPTSTNPSMTAALSFITDHLDQVTVPAVGRAAGVSERTLRRLFERELGMTCRSYIIQARLLRAMVVLADPNRTILDAATTVGFVSGSAFARAFAARCGESPSEYRRRLAGAPGPADL